MNRLVRMKSIKIKNFKNIEKSDIAIEETFNSDATHANLLGLYGQNGSGKTAVIELLSLYKDLLMNEKSISDYENEINVNSNSLELSFNLFILYDNIKYDVTYSFELIRVNNNYCNLNNERIVILSEDNLAKKIVLNHAKKINNKLSLNDTMISLQEEDYLSLLETVLITHKEYKSTFFNNEFITFIEKMDVTLSTILKILKEHATLNFYVFDVKKLNTIGAADMMHTCISYALNKCDQSSFTRSDFLISLFDKMEIEKEYSYVVDEFVGQTNQVMEKLVPGFRIELKKYGEHLLFNGNMGIYVEMVSSLKKNDGRFIPLKYESEGIKKIVSICGALIAMYNNPTVFVAIDELDSSIFEYLLGQLVRVLYDGGAGQLIFTSHNLRVLEVLPKNTILFSTANPLKRFVPIRNVKTNNNLRDYYLRNVMNGGSKDILYNETNDYEIHNAFIKAGDIMPHGEE